MNDCLDDSQFCATVVVVGGGGGGGSLDYKAWGRGFNSGLSLGRFIQHSCPDDCLVQFSLINMQKGDVIILTSISYSHQAVER